MTKTLKQIPEFDNEEDERAFWESNDSTDFIDWSRAKRVSFPNLKPSTRTISLRLPVSLLEELQMAAHKRDVPYQSLLKTFLADRLAEERRQTSTKA
jgi:predicted DNA binding CopG/RHH family protein